MKSAIQTDKKNWHKIIVRVLFAISVVVVCVGCINLIRERNVRIAEEERIRQEEERIRQEEEEYIKLERFFREKKEDMQKFIKLSKKSILGEEEYIIIFDKGWYYSSSRDAYKQGGWIPVLYDKGTFVLEDNAEIEKTLNENADLAEALDSIRENEVIISILQIKPDEDMWMVSFGISTEFTPHIITNDISKRFIYCENVDDERYEYKNIEGDWYEYIDLNEKGRAIQEEKEYTELEKLFWENKEDMQRVINAFDESTMGENQYSILFDGESYRSELSRNKTSDYLSVLYIGGFVIEEDEEMEKVFNKNIELREAVEAIEKNGVITDISIFYKDDMRMVEFWIDTKFTPFITSNNGVENSFAWCDNKDCKIYGYKNVEGNWYMYIEVAPE